MFAVVQTKKRLIETEGLTLANSKVHANATRFNWFPHSWAHVSTIYQ